MKKNIIIIFILLFNIAAFSQEEELTVRTITEKQALEIEVEQSIKETSDEEEIIPVKVLTEQDLIDLEEEVLRRHESHNIQNHEDLSYVIYSPEELKKLTNPEYFERDLDKEKLQLESLSSKADPKWDTYKEWMASPEWVADQSEIGLAGTIYQKGWMGPRVSRQIVPDQNEGWLVVDAVTIGPSLLLQASNLAANILFHQVFPYAQGGVIKEKSFLNVRHRTTYEEALTTKPFSFTKVPLTTEGFKNIENGEVLTTVSTGGVFARIGGGILDLLGIEVPLGFNIGPRLKFEVKQSLKLNVSKIDKDNVLISVERAKDSASGFGIGFGIFFDDLLDIPVTLSVNTRNGWAPLVFNYKVQRRKTRSIVFKVNIATKEGREAYHRFIKRDFTMLEEMANQVRPKELVYDENGDVFGEELIESGTEKPVQLEMIKEGQIYRSEFNAAINLILFRAGLRNILVDAKYNTIMGNGKRFEYEEVSREYITDSKWFSGDEDTSEKYSVLVPLKEDGEIVTLKKGAFVLDSNFYFADTKTNGGELIEISKELAKSGNQMKLPIKLDPDKNYGSTQVGLSVRFTPMAIRTILESEREDIFVSVGTAIGLPDPYVLESQEERARYINKAKSSSAKKKRRRVIKGAEAYVNYITQIQRMNSMSAQARELLDLLFDGDTGDVLHKTLIDLAGQDKIIIKGHVRGRYF
ncbi:MAG: hypothetical protein CME70_14650 [Halobacteriovorax sp.]|nr:hypothetical protein [Halobacteriovorax sp.]|tara:strand:- start:200425 stop:202509 length:2085 start_codon:yes stop_codon:yes gene_type:complete